MINEKELIDLLDEITNPDVQIITSGLRSKANEMLKSIKGSPQDEKVCYCNNKHCLHNMGKLCMAATWNCKDRQTDK